MYSGHSSASIHGGLDLPIIYRPDEFLVDGHYWTSAVYFFEEREFWDVLDSGL